MGSYIVLFSAPVFLVSVLGHIFVKVRMRPGEDSGLDDYYHEFEDQHPGLVRYDKWSRITLAGAVVGALGLFLGMVL